MSTKIVILSGRYANRRPWQARRILLGQDLTLPVGSGIL
jgi:hypothetical protein